MCLFCAVSLGGKANWISVSCQLKAGVLMLLTNLSRNRLPHSCIAQTGFSISAEDLALRRVDHGLHFGEQVILSKHRICALDCPECPG